jgi:LysR family transcriptional regulator, hca operon transcriptional activator
VTSRPIRGDAPTIDLVVGYNKANRSPILKLFLSRVDDLSAQMSSHRALKALDMARLAKP